jgi:4-hydroxy-4-methyl-2-oxoglutarate aldolase
MTDKNLNSLFSELSTPLVADACLRLGLPLRLAPPPVRPLTIESRVAGCVLPVQHYGSVDIFLEAMGTAQPGDVLVIDNGGRMDEGCIGDLTVLEARACGLAGLIVWGCHRDTPELMQIGLPVFSCGTCPAGPQRLDPRKPEALGRANFGSFAATKEDIVFADADGVLFVPGRHSQDVLAAATSIWNKERQQAQAIRTGKTLREQLRFDEYLARRSADAAYTFRQHLRAIGGAIEE